MKIATKSIESYIGKPDAGHRAVLLYGPDSGLIRERAKRLTAKFLGEKPDPLALLDIPESVLLSDPARLADELSAISMLSPKRVIFVQDGGDKLTGLIEDAQNHFNDSVLLIICGDELSARSSLRAWFEKAPNAGAIACYRDETRDVQNILRQRFEAEGIRTNRDVMDYLVSQLGNDRGVTHQEIEKLVTFTGESKELSLEDAQSLVDYNRETNFDDVINAVADRNLVALEKNLTLMLREGTQPVAYLRALLRYFNRLYYLRARMSEGMSAEMAIAGLRPAVFFRQVPILTRHLQNWNENAIVKALRLLTAAELACKTSDLPPIPASSRRLLQVTQLR